MRLGPEPQDGVVVVHEHDPPSGANGTHQDAHGVERGGQVLEQEARVREIEAAPFLRRERRIERIPPAQLEVRQRAGQGGGRGELPLVALDTEHRAAREPLGERAGEDAGPRPHLEGALVPPGRQDGQLALVQERIHEPQARLLPGRRAVDVAASGHGRRSLVSGLLRRPILSAPKRGAARPC